MNKQASLSVLIKHSFLLTEEAKNRLLTSLPKLSEEEINKLGRLLALEKNKSLESSNAKILNQVLHDLDTLSTSKTH